MTETEEPWAHCVECGDPIYKRPHGSHPRCKWCAVRKHFG